MVPCCAKKFTLPTTSEGRNERTLPLLSGRRGLDDGAGRCSCSRAERSKRGLCCFRVRGPKWSSASSVAGFPAAGQADRDEPPVRGWHGCGWCAAGFSPIRLPPNALDREPGLVIRSRYVDSPDSMSDHVIFTAW